MLYTHRGDCIFRTLWVEVEEKCHNEITWNQPPYLRQSLDTPCPWSIWCFYTHNCLPQADTVSLSFYMQSFLPALEVKINNYKNGLINGSCLCSHYIHILLEKLKKKKSMKTKQGMGQQYKKISLKMSFKLGLYELPFRVIKSNFLIS